MKFLLIAIAFLYFRKIIIYNIKVWLGIICECKNTVTVNGSAVCLKCGNRWILPPKHFNCRCVSMPIHSMEDSGEY